MLHEYLPAFLMLAAALGVSLLLFALTSGLGPKRMTREKALPYESGSETTGGKALRVSVKFYLTAILFVVFDVEAVFLYPWGQSFRQLGWVGYFEMLSFVFVLGITLLYAWKKGALEWER